MRIDLLPQKTAYKANLHTHSNLSDGKLTPEELAKLYREHGYQILSITDHEFFMDHSDLNQEGFLMLTGYELQIVDESVRPRKMNQRCCHLCILSKDPHEFSHVYFNPESYDLNRLCHKPELIPHMKSVGERPVQKTYSKEVISKVVKTCVENNMLVAYNHPTWSLENDYEDYTFLDGIYAMEIYNNDCGRGIGLEEYNPAVYDRMLRKGMQVGCIATDDAHCGKPLGHPKCDLFGGWTMIMADDLSYGSVIRALENRDFYATTGPEIKELYAEDGRLFVRTSDAYKIAVTTAGRRGDSVFAAPGEAVNEFETRIDPEDGYVRVTVTDHHGFTANSRGYFLSEIL